MYQNCIHLEFDVIPIGYRSCRATIITNQSYTHQQKHTIGSQTAQKFKKKTATRYGAKTPSSVSVQHTVAPALVYTYLQSVILLCGVVGTCDRLTQRSLMY